MTVRRSATIGASTLPAMFAVLALLASLTYGAADFLGGLMGRRIPTLLVVLWSQAVGLVLMLGVALAFPARDVRPTDVIWGAGGGLFATLGLYFLYQGLATGRMAVVSPVTALVGALVPVAIGLGLGERPSSLEWTGIALGLPAIWLVAAVASGTDEEPGGILHGLIAGTGFGLFFAAIAQTGDGSGFWPLLGARIAQVGGVYLVSLRMRLGVPPQGTRLGLVMVGVGDILANVLLLLAFRSGLLTLVSVLASLYPAMTVLLAVSILHEQIGRRQRVGLALALVAVGLIAS
jgi:drug/metabolite transporter (DMT)-like permease